MRRLDVDAFATSGNGSLASLDRPAVLADKLDWLRHAMEAYTGAPFLPQAALGVEDVARQSMFEQIYKSGTWQHGNASLPLSGTGSTAEASANARIALAAALGRTRARSVLDAPCGDFTWMRLMLPTFARLGVHYTGVDIARPQIARLQAEFEGTAGVEFRVGDLVVEPPPRATAGLIFSREMTQHLNPEEVLRVLHHWSRSGSRSGMPAVPHASATSDQLRVITVDYFTTGTCCRQPTGSRTAPTATLTACRAARTR